MEVIDIPALRFISEEQYTKLINLYHLARVAGKHKKYDRMIWACKELEKEYGKPMPGAYKDLYTRLAGY